MTFEDAIGLHQELRVMYLVDGYQASIIDDCTLRVLHEGPVEPTVLQAFAALGQQLAKTHKDTK